MVVLRVPSNQDDVAEVLGSIMTTQDGVATKETNRAIRTPCGVHAGDVHTSWVATETLDEVGQG